MIKLDDSVLAQELRVIREELRVVKTLIGDLKTIVLKHLPEGTIVASPDHAPMRVLTTKQVLGAIPISPGRMKNLRKAGLFPKPISALGKGRDAWLERDIQEWLAGQRNGAEAS